jgi:hypothetical protein
LKSDFVENEDYLPLAQNGERSSIKKIKQNGGKFSGENKIDYFLSVECMEYFIAKRVKSVFDVYRKVFHKVIESATEPKQLSKRDAKFPQETVFVVRMGDHTNQVYISQGFVYAKMNTILEHMGYSNSGYAHRIGLQFIKTVSVGNKQVKFINKEGFDKLLPILQRPPTGKMVAEIYNMFALEHQGYKTPYVFKYTKAEMFDIIKELDAVPVSKDRVRKLLYNGEK